MNENIAVKKLSDAVKFGQCEAFKGLRTGQYKKRKEKKKQ